MAHVHIKTNAQAHARPKTVASAKGKAVSGQPHIAARAVGKLSYNKKAC